MKMFLALRPLFFPLIIALLFALNGCKNANQEQTSTNKKVFIQEKNSRFELYRNGRPFQIKGAAGYSHFADLHKAGGNAMRTWDTTHLGSILDSAQANHIAVVAGLPVENSYNIDFYNNPKARERQLNVYQKLINRYKNHPALLMWCVGNELDFPNHPRFLPFYSAFNDFTDMVHRTDPDHPVTTTVLNFNRNYILNIRFRCNLDLISFNIFNTLAALESDLQKLDWLWDGPFMILEWGINGPWEGTDHTAWNAYIEDTSKKKADVCLHRYQDLPHQNPRFLGAFIFFWGQKQEFTHTWFSIFDEQGRSSETAGIMEYLWTGRKPVSYPMLQYMLLNQKGARDNIMLRKNSKASAEVLMFPQADRIKSVQWEIYHEDWYKKTKIFSEVKPAPIEGLLSDAGGLKAQFTVPEKEGPYRIFATIYDDHGRFATCNTPFYVLDENE